jgi:hypothetical protein
VTKEETFIERLVRVTSELDAAFFHHYLPAEVNGDYCTKRVILEIWDALCPAAQADLARPDSNRRHPTLVAAMWCGRKV